MKNNKGFQLGIQTVALIVLVLITLLTITVFVMGTFEAPAQASQEVTETARDEATDLGLLDRLRGLGTGGVCDGEEISSGQEVCGYYYDSSYGDGGDATVSVSSCGTIGGYPNTDTGQCHLGGEPDAVCINSCSDLTETGRSFCEERGCVWLSS